MSNRMSNDTPDENFEHCMEFSKYYKEDTDIPTKVFFNNIMYGILKKIANISRV